MKQSTRDNETRNLYKTQKIEEEEGERKFLFKSDDTLSHKQLRQKYFIKSFAYFGQ